MVVKRKANPTKETSLLSKKKATNPIQDIPRLAKECLSSRKNLNHILTLLAWGENNEEKVAFAALSALMQVFQVLKREADGISTQNTPAVMSKSISEWVEKQFKLYIDIVFKQWSNSSKQMQLHCLHLLLEAVKVQTLHLSSVEKQFAFPNMLFGRICEACWEMKGDEAQVEESLGHLIAAWVSLLDEYADLRYYFYKNIEKLAKKDEKCQPVFALLVLLKCNPLPDQEEWDPQFYTSVPELEDYLTCCRVAQWQDQRKAFSDGWLAVLKCSISFDMYRQILLVLHKRILPCLEQPTLLMDFLADTFNSGGLVSLLALNGLFTLITQHNLDYPDFYKKLYSLLDDQVTRAKYRSRFFRLLALFLSSTHLPAQLVASFIKRLSLLTLSSPPAATLVILPLIYNLLRSHPSCIKMIHTSGQVEPGCEDVFNKNEVDPEKTQAMDSYLWEIKTMQHHYVSSISTLAHIFEEPLSKPMYDLEDFLDTNYDQLIVDQDYENAEKAALRDGPDAVPLVLSHDFY